MISWVVITLYIKVWSIRYILLVWLLKRQRRLISISAKRDRDQRKLYLQFLSLIEAEGNGESAGVSFGSANTYFRYLQIANRWATLLVNGLIFVDFRHLARQRLCSALSLGN